MTTYSRHQQRIPRDQMWTVVLDQVWPPNRNGFITEIPGALIQRPGYTAEGRAGKLSGTVRPPTNWQQQETKGYPQAVGIKGQGGVFGGQGCITGQHCTRDGPGGCCTRPEGARPDFLPTSYSESHGSHKRAAHKSQPQQNKAEQQNGEKGPEAPNWFTFFQIFSFSIQTLNYRHITWDCY